MKKRRVSQVDLCYKANFIKTFDNEIYELKGTLAVDKKTGDVTRVADIYYRVRTAVNDYKNIVAKRKRIDDELCTYSKKKAD